MLDHLLFNRSKFYPMNDNADSITVGNRTFKEYKFQKYSTKLNNVGTDRFTLIDDYHKLDMNKFTVVAFDNGDTYRSINYVLYTHLDSSSTFYNPTSEGNYFDIRKGLGNDSIQVYYHGLYTDSDRRMHETPIDVKWCQIDINVD